MVSKEKNKKKHVGAEMETGPTSSWAAHAVARLSNMQGHRRAARLQMNIHNSKASPKSPSCAGEHPHRILWYFGPKQTGSKGIDCRYVGIRECRDFACNSMSIGGYLYKSEKVRDWMWEKSNGQSAQVFVQPCRMLDEIDACRLAWGTRQDEQLETTK